MYIDFNIQAGGGSDTGVADGTSIQPIQTGEYLTPAVLGRATDNLRNRTELLRVAVDEANLTTAAPIMTVLDNNGNRPTLYWHGPYDPTTGSAVPAFDAPGSGAPYIDNKDGGSGIQILFYPANAAATARPATVSYTTPNNVPLTFTVASTMAAVAANRMKIAIVGDLVAGTATAVHVNPTLAIPQPASPGYPPAGYCDTLELHIRLDGTTTIAQVKTAMASPTGGAIHPALTMTMTSPSPDATTLSMGGVESVAGLLCTGASDPTFWALPMATLATFFNQGKFSTTASADILSGTDRVVTLGTVAGLAVGQVIDVDLGTSYEQITISAVNVGLSQVTATFVKSHTGPVVLKAAPYRLRSGDTLCVALGQGRARLGHGATITAGELLVSRVSATASDVPVVPLFSVPPGSTRLMWGLNPINSGEQFPSGGNVQWAGDIADPSGSAASPVLVRGNAGHAGALFLNTDSGVTATTSGIDSSGNVLAGGITRPTPGAVSIGPNANDTSVLIATPSVSTSVRGSLTVGTGLTVSAGNAVVSAGSLTVGNGLTVNSGNAVVSTGSLSVGNGLTVSSGNAVVSSGSLTVGNGLTVSSGNAVVAGGSLTVATGTQSITVGNASGALLDLANSGVSKFNVSSGGTTTLTGLTSTSGSQYNNSPPITLRSTFWSGVSSIAYDATVQLLITNPSVGKLSFSLGGAEKGSLDNNGNFTAHGHVYTDGVNSYTGGVVSYYSPISITPSGTYDAISFTTDGPRLHLGSNASSYIYAAGATLYTPAALNVTGAVATGALTVTGAMTASGNITAFYSDARLKMGVTPIADPLTKLSALRGVSWTWDKDACAQAGFTPDEDEDVGLIAQEVQAVLPHAVGEAANKDYLAIRVSNHGVVALLIEAVKALKAEVEELKKGKA